MNTSVCSKMEKHIHDEHESAGFLCDSDPATSPANPVQIQYIHHNWSIFIGNKVSCQSLRSVCINAGPLCHESHTMTLHRPNSEASAIFQSCFDVCLLWRVVYASRHFFLVPRFFEHHQQNVPKVSVIEKSSDLVVIQIWFYEFVIILINRICFVKLATSTRLLSVTHCKSIEIWPTHTHTA